MLKKPVSFRSVKKSPQVLTSDFSRRSLPGMCAVFASRTSLKVQGRTSWPDSLTDYHHVILFSDGNTILINKKKLCNIGKEEEPVSATCLASLLFCHLLSMENNQRPLPKRNVFTTPPSLY